MVSALGIDVAKDKLDVVLMDDAQHEHSGLFANNPKGFKKLQQWLTKRVQDELHAGLEAAGQYGDAVAAFLYAAGCTVSVVNPARIKAFAASRLSRQKTDQTDARLIALSCQSQRPEAWTPPAPEQRTLQAMVRHLRDVKAIRQQESNRLTSGVSADAVIRALQHHIAFLDEQTLELERQIHDHLDDFPLLKQQPDLLDSEDLYTTSSLGGGNAPINSIDLLGQWEVLEAIPRLIAILETDDPDAIVDGKAASALGKMGTAVFEPMMAFDARTEHKYQDGVAGILADACKDDPRAYDYVLKLFEEKKEEYQVAYMAENLLVCDPQQAIPYLEAWMRKRKLSRDLKKRLENYIATAKKDYFP